MSPGLEGAESEASLFAAAFRILAKAASGICQILCGAVGAEDPAVFWFWDELCKVGSRAVKYSVFKSGLSLDSMPVNKGLKGTGALQ